jgi:hypothetical protein
VFIRRDCRVSKRPDKIVIGLNYPVLSINQLNLIGRKLFCWMVRTARIRILDVVSQPGRQGGGRG